MAAMALIEAQNLLRQQDSFAYSQWQLQAQMQAASAPVDLREPETQAVEPDPIIAPATPPVVIPVVVAPVESAVPAVAQEASVDEIVAALNRNYVNAGTNDDNFVNEVSAALSPPVPALATENKQISFEQLISGEEESLADASSNPTETPVQTELAEDEDEDQVIGVTRTRKAAALSWSLISIAS
jgi:hypothetical protein